MKEKRFKQQMNELILDDGSEIHSNEEIMKELTSYYRKLFAKETKDLHTRQ